MTIDIVKIGSHAARPQKLIDRLPASFITEVIINDDETAFHYLIEKEVEADLCRSIPVGVKTEDCDRADLR